MVILLRCTLVQAQCDRGLEHVLNTAGLKAPQDVVDQLQLLSNTPTKVADICVHDCSLHTPVEASHHGGHGMITLGRCSCYSTAHVLSKH
jgi:hypothetical protein